MFHELPLGQTRCENCYRVFDEADLYSVALVDSVDGKSLLNENITLCEPCVHEKKYELETLPVDVVVQRLYDIAPVPAKG
jgi:hypothetical protein